MYPNITVHANEVHFLLNGTLQYFFMIFLKSHQPLVKCTPGLAEFRNTNPEIY